jgi:S1-C subfamily serine protease
MRNHGLRGAAPIALALLAVLAAPTRARADDDEMPALPLPAGVQVRGSIPTDPDAPHARVYRIEVGDDVVAIRLELDAQADLDLYVHEEMPEADAVEKDAVVSSKEPTGTERITFDRSDRGGDKKSLRTGPYFIAVTWPERRQEEPPRSATGRKITAIGYTIRVTEIRERVDAALTAGVAVRGEIRPQEGSFRTYTIEVPKGAPCLRLDLYGTPADLNLRVRHGAPMLAPSDADAVARTPLGTEVLILRPDGDPPLEPGRYYVDVVDEVGLDWQVPFSLRASFDERPDPSLLALPQAPAASTPLERALYSTVEIIGDEGGGSGVVLNDRGMILTNYHVVQEKVESHGEIGAPLAVALTTDPRDPPHEAFRARVVTASAELDLALLECTSGLYGQPIPEDYRFPTAAIGNPAKLAVGAPLVCVGYPEAGGSGSRVSVTYTRGVLAGFERRGKTLHMKTDCMINSGNSGGSALDADMEVIGLPTETISDQGTHGQIGYIRPLWLVPPSWWELARIAPPGQ